jgi:preprotein translocase subunit SecE
MVKKIKNYIEALAITLALLMLTVLLNYTTLKVCVYTLCILLLIFYATRNKKKIVLYYVEVLNEVNNVLWSKFPATMRMFGFVLCVVLIFCVTLQCIDLLTALLIKKIY